MAYGLFLEGQDPLKYIPSFRGVGLSESKSPALRPTGEVQACAGDLDGTLASRGGT